MGHSRLNWTPEEQQALKWLKERGDFLGWKKIAQELNRKFESRTRTGKQCRQRYMNYIKFAEQSLNLAGWTCQQDINLFKNFRLYGARWVLISRQMPHRSQNSLKNRFYGILRKILRKMEKVIRVKKIKQNKALKLATLIQVLEKRKQSICYQEKRNAIYEDQYDLAYQLSQQLLKLGMNRFEEPPVEQIAQTIRKFYKFLSQKKINHKKALLKCKLDCSNSFEIQFQSNLKKSNNIKMNNFCETQRKPSDSRVSLDKIIQSYQKAEKDRKKDELQDQQQLSLPYQFSSGQNVLKNNNSYDILDEIQGTEYF